MVFRVHVRVVVRVVVEDWGRVTSLRAWYAGGLEVEFGLATIDWATRPDEGTRRVLGDGAHVLLDRDGIFARPPSQEGAAGSSGKEGYGR